MMDVQAVLQAYDRYERRERVFADMRREDVGPVVRHIHRAEPSSMVLWSRLDAANADAVIADQVAFYNGIGHKFEWKLYDYDTPADLRDRLVAHGFAPEDPEALLALDLQTAPAELLAPPKHAVQRITDPELVPEVLSVQDEVWGWDPELARMLAGVMRLIPDDLSVYAVYDGDLPVSSAWIDFTEASPFCGMWGGATLPAYRGRGIYTALVAVRAQEAIARGKRYLTIDASPMSRPICERQGFQFLTYTQPYVHEPK